MNAILPGRQTAQLDLAFPGSTRFGRKEGVVHLAVFLDRIRFGRVITVNVKVFELTLRQHLRVIESRPFFPVFFLVRSERNFRKLRIVVAPGKFRAHHSASSNRRGKIATNFPILPRLGLRHFREFHVIAIYCGIRAKQRLIPLDAATHLNCSYRIGCNRLVHRSQPS